MTRPKIRRPATVVRLTPTGGLDAGYNRAGRKLYDVGGPDDAFLGVAVSPDGRRVAAVGYLGRDTGGDEKDDGAVLWLRPGGRSRDDHRGEAP